MGNKKILQVYGCMNSGTNYITWLLRNNFTTPVSRERKHDGPHTPNGEHYDEAHYKEFALMIEQDGIDNDPSDFFDPDEVYFVFIIRNPRTLRTSGRGSCDISSWNMYNTKHYNFYKENKERSIYVKYESLLDDKSRNEVLDEIKLKFDLQKKHEEYVNLKRHTHWRFNEQKNVNFDKKTVKINGSIEGVDPFLLKIFEYD